MELVPINAVPFTDFDTASRTVLKFLQSRLGFDLWMMTRTEGNDWIVLQASDQGYGVAEGTVFNWADSFCSRMVLGEGPMVAPDVASVAVYCQAPIAQQVHIGAYIGVPVMRGDGALFGTLCAIDPSPQRDSIRDELPLVEVLGRLLGTILATELKAMELARLSRESQIEALTDVLTGLYNRRGWARALAAEESRMRRYGGPACVLIIDLDDLKEVNDTQGHDRGDELIRRAGEVIKNCVRESDLVARLGGDEFGVLAVECGGASAQALLLKVRQALVENGVKASVGVATRNPRLSLEDAVAEADRNMYAEKSSK